MAFYCFLRLLLYGSEWFVSPPVLGAVTACSVMLCAAFWRNENQFLAQMSNLKSSGC